MAMHIRPFTPTDTDKICEIYNFYIANSVATFEEAPLTPLAMQDRITECTNRYPWLVCELDGVVRGYAYASGWKARSAYKNTVEVTVYLENGFAKNGYGKALYAALLAQLQQLKVHVLLGCITLPNGPSEQLHEYFGFKKVAHFSEVGFKFGRWLDVGYWQKIMA